jgi:SNF2 family DNA or RNA helicase
VGLKNYGGSCLGREHGNIEKAVQAHARPCNAPDSDEEEEDSDDDCVIVGEVDPKKAEAEAEAAQRPLEAVAWFRLILDEGHTVRNPRTAGSKSIMRLRWHKMLYLSGTPIQNSLDDLQQVYRLLRSPDFGQDADTSVEGNKVGLLVQVELSLPIACKRLVSTLEPKSTNISFLSKLCRYDTAAKKAWLEKVARPMRKRDSQEQVRAFRDMNASMQTFMIRRLKKDEINGARVLELPDIVSDDREQEFSLDEAEVYDAIWKQAKAKVNAWLRRGDAMNNIAFNFVQLLRLRQACAHPSLVIGKGDK